MCYEHSIENVRSVVSLYHVYNVFTVKDVNKRSNPSPIDNKRGNHSEIGLHVGSQIHQFETVQLRI